MRLLKSSSTDERLDATTIAEDVEEAEHGSRRLGPYSRRFVCFVALCWSLFQLYLAYRPINSIIARSIHLTFAIVLVYLSYGFHRRPGGSLWLRNLVGRFGPNKSTSRTGLPWSDVLLALLAACGAAYVAWDYEGIVERSGLPLARDVYIGAGFIVLLLEAARRSLGVPLPILATLFLVYCFTGRSLPRFLAHPGVPLDFVVDHMYLTDSGIWGVPLGVSTDFVFLFVLFGSFLDRAGAAQYFVQVAFAALGGFRGGPAKAAVLASGLTGLVSGSSIANVVTTGTFTIPLMKKVGLPAYKAGAVEVGASTNGQLLPPVMGAAAFIMAEFLGLPYLDVVTAAAIPALLSYVALLYVVHLEAMKLNLRGLPREELPPFWSTFVRGIYFLAPIAVLIYNLVILRFSAVESVYRAIILTVVIMVLQRPIQAYLKARRNHNGNGLGRTLSEGLASGLNDVLQGLIAGGRNMASIGVATAGAGIIVGTVTLTGLSSRFIEAIEIVSLGNVVLMLGFTALTSLVLGMGLPTTANYIVMATLTAPVIVELAAQGGLLIPALAAHLFVFYYGILADDTPPVGLAAFAASAIARSEPIRTGIQGFTYDLRTAILPFVFIFNLELLLIAGVGPDGQIIWLHDIFKILWVVLVSLVAMLAFAAGLQGYFADRCHWWERLILLSICLVAFRPGLFVEGTGFLRSALQFGAVAAFAGFYLIQRVRMRSREDVPNYG